MNTLKTVPLLGKHAFEYVKLGQQEILKNLSFKRFYLMVRQDFPWIATIIIDLANNASTKNPDALAEYTYYLQSMKALSEISITDKSAFTLLNAKWLSELGRQPDRLRIIYDKDQDFIEYPIRISLLEKEKIVIQIK
ncbi:hypothetical protein [Dyadobacter arcticus]|uniref:Uncharacterized protein n=1 Tax=Dyadobacter arcticus TaxID=1078754 RepID=A0ABX0UP04_9BACT|nr:hypothetical protein [Dyadobacter arcticus]NIJ54667.1 hypothetical protein [Dyadobacter arcticus]